MLAAASSEKFPIFLLQPVQSHCRDEEISDPHLRYECPLMILIRCMPSLNIQYASQGVPG